VTPLSQTTTPPPALPKPREYDGYAPIHYCTCGCGRVIGDGDWATGNRLCIDLRRRADRARAIILARR
jgi:hypothetical protein